MDALRAYHGDPIIKEHALARVRADQFAGNPRRGAYWSHGDPSRGIEATFPVGFLARAEAELGIPAGLARLAQTIFAGLPDLDASIFPEALLTAIPVGTDLSLVTARFHCWLFTDPQDGPAQFCDAPLRHALDQICELLTQSSAGEALPDRAWDEAARRVAAIRPCDDATDARYGG